MNKNRLWQFVVTFICTLYGFSKCWGQPVEEKSPTTERRTYPLETALLYQGFKVDGYFTLERYHKDQSAALKPIEPIESLTSNTIDDTVEELRLKLPAFRVERDARNRCVIHLMEKGLETVDKYALEQQVSFQFSAPLGHMTWYLAKNHGLKIGRRRWGGFKDFYDDDKTFVTFSTQQNLVRDILSDYIPLSSYSRLIWRSEELVVSEPEEAEKRQSWPQFSGVIQERGLRSSLISVYPGFIRNLGEELQVPTTSPFSTGQVAYLFNANTPQNVEAAQQFINEQMKTKAPHQVRWAMLFLGKHKVESALPLLLQHLTYQYTNAGLIEESYPVVRALMLMGEPATQSILDKLKSEPDALRCRLLVKAVLGERNADENKIKIENLIAQIQQPEQQQRIRTALQDVLLAPTSWQIVYPQETK